MPVEHSPLGPVQVAIYTWLANDSALTALAPVYEEVPQSTPFPYIEIAELVATPDNVLGPSGRQVVVSIFAFSQSPGFKELQTILQRLMYLLDEVEIPNTSAAMNPSLGWMIWNNMVVTEETIKLPGIPTTRQLAVRVQIDVMETDGG